MSTHIPKLNIKSGETVKIIAGGHKGKTGKVLRTSPRDRLLFIEGIGVVKRHVKPTQLNPRGGTKEIHIGLDVSKVVRIEKKKSASKPAKKEKK